MSDNEEMVEVEFWLPEEVAEQARENTEVGLEECIRRLYHQIATHGEVVDWGEVIGDE